LGKLVVLLLVAVAIYLLVKGLKKPAAPPARKPAASIAGERMVTCAHCGINLPESDATAAGFRFFCSDEHRRLAEP
jgi:uncharacterized protein